MLHLGVSYIWLISHIGSRRFQNIEHYINFADTGVICVLQAHHVFQEFLTYHLSFTCKRRLVTDYLTRQSLTWTINPGVLIVRHTVMACKALWEYQFMLKKFVLVHEKKNKKKNIRLSNLPL